MSDEYKRAFLKLLRIKRYRQRSVKYWRRNSSVEVDAQEGKGRASYMFTFPYKVTQELSRYFRDAMSALIAHHFCIILKGHDPSVRKLFGQEVTRPICTILTPRVNTVTLQSVDDHDASCHTIISILPARLLSYMYAVG